MSIVISDETLQRIQLSESELLTEIAIMLFQQEKFTLGQASSFAKMNQLQFQRLLASRQISPHYGIAELKEDVESLEANNWRWLLLVIHHRERNLAAIGKLDLSFFREKTPVLTGDESLAALK